MTTRKAIMKEAFIPGLIAQLSEKDKRYLDESLARTEPDPIVPIKMDPATQAVLDRYRLQLAQHTDSEE